MPDVAAALAPNVLPPRGKVALRIIVPQALSPAAGVQSQTFVE